jgi:YfiH family protein
MKQPRLHFYTIGEGVTAFSSTRQGGYSEGRYGEFNINRYCGDDEQHIRQNRASLCELLGIRDERLIMPHQVHEAEIIVVDNDFLQLSDTERQQRLEGVDALMTNVPEVCIGVSTADCIPVLLFDRVRRVSAAIHAGWRGTAKRIVEKTVAAMTATYGCCPQDIVAQIGPGIHLDSFEVGDEVYASFVQEGFPMETISRKYPAHDGSLIEKWHIDLPECNRQQLLSCGIPDSQIMVSEICTYQQYERFFSARRLGINSGRIFTGICMSCDAAAKDV